MPPASPDPAAHRIALLVPAVLVFGLVLGVGWVALLALVAWLVLVAVIGFALLLALNEFCRPSLFGAADTVVVTGTASLLAALIVAGFLGA